MPNLNLNYGLYDKNSGLYFEEIDNNLGFCDDEAIITENECPNNQWNQNENYGSVIDITDNRIITQTNNMSLTLSQNLTFGILIIIFHLQYLNPIQMIFYMKIEY